MFSIKGTPLRDTICLSICDNVWLQNFWRSSSICLTIVVEKNYSILYLSIQCLHYLGPFISLYFFYLVWATDSTDHTLLTPSNLMITAVWAASLGLELSYFSHRKVQNRFAFSVETIVSYSSPSPSSYRFSALINKESDSLLFN